MRRFRALCALGAAGLLVVTACGGDDDDSADEAPATSDSDSASDTATIAPTTEPTATTEAPGTTAGSPTTVASATTEAPGTTAPATPGAPIKLTTVGDAEVGGASTAPYTDGFNAWVSLVNSEGGVNGHMIETSFCDSGVDPAKASSCMQEVANDPDVVGVAGGLSLVGPTAIAPAAERLGMLYLPSYTTGLQDASMPNSFVVEGSTVAWLSGATSYVVDEVGTKSVAIIRSDVPGTANNGDVVKAAAESAGGTLVADIPVPLTATDFLPSVTEAVAKGADLIVANLGSNTSQAMASAVVSGGFASDVTVLVSSAHQALPAIVEAADAGLTIYSFDTFVVTRPDGEGHEEMLATAEAAGTPDAWQDGRWVIGYMAGLTLGEIIKSIEGEVTRESLLEAATTGTFDVQGITDPLSLVGAPEQFPALAVKSIYIKKVPGEVVAGPVPAFNG